MKTISRFASLVLLALGHVSHPLSAQTAPAQPAPLSPVILVQRASSINEFTANPTQVESMLRDGLLKLTSAPDVATAWKRLGVTPQDVVGIKITTQGGPAMSTHRALVHAIADGLRAAGVPSSQIIIWDKFQDKMMNAGYLLRAATDDQASIQSVVPSLNYDPKVIYKNDTIGSLVYGDYQFMQSLSYGDDDSDDPVLVNSYYTQFVTQTCTKIINVPVLTDDAYVGIYGCLASLALDSVDNNRRFQGAPTFGNPAIDDILNPDFMRRKVILNIMDALVAQFAGGPTFHPEFCQQTGALYISRDPVAIDSLVLPYLEKLRVPMDIPPIGNSAAHIQTANAYNLGTTNRAQIQLIELP